MRFGLIALIALALLVGVAGAAPQPVGSDFRISNTGDDGGADREASKPAQAYNPTANEYLVVWTGDGLAANDEFEIFGQRLDAGGAKVGGELRISQATDVGAERDAFEPAVTYNPTVDEYLVAWSGDGLATNDDFEIFGQRLDANGAEMGEDFPISNVTAVGTNRDAFDPALAYNSVSNQYLVVWEGFDLATVKTLGVFGQRLGGDGGALGGDFPITDVSPENDVNRFVGDPALAYNSASNQYLVVWEGNGPATDTEAEIFGQRLDGIGGEVEGELRISNTGTDGNHERVAIDPALAYNPTANEYLVAWAGDGLATDNEFEIFAQPLSADGAEIGADLRISTVGTDGVRGRVAGDAVVASNPTANEYLVSWEADGLATDDEFEIFGRRLTEPGLSPDPPGPPSPQAGKCAGVTATKTGTPGADVIKGTPKRDVIATLGGRDTVRSLGGNDLVCGGAGTDRIFGGKGKDKLRGDAGADKLNGDSGKDDLRGGKGRDVLNGGKGRDVLKGGKGKDVLAGGPGKDRERR